MNSQVTPIPEMCVHYLKEIKKGRKNESQWFKALKKRGVSPEFLQKPDTDEDLIASIERIKEEYTIHG